MRRRRSTVAIRASAAVKEKYRRRLAQIVKEMAAEIHVDIVAEFRTRLHRAQIIADASLVDALNAILVRLRAKWVGRVDRNAEREAAEFVNEVRSHVDRGMARLLAYAHSQPDEPEAGPDKAQASRPDAEAEPEVELPPRRGPRARRLAGRDYQVTLDAAVAENVALIKSIPAQYLDSVQRQVLLAAQMDWPLDQIVASLRDEYGVSQRRAELIARDQCAKITNRMLQQRMLTAGFTHAIWHHSAGGRFPRKSHQRADGVTFDLREGCPIDDEHIVPGEKINCRCFMEPVI